MGKKREREREEKRQTTTQQILQSMSVFILAFIKGFNDKKYIYL